MIDTPDTNNGSHTSSGAPVTILDTGVDYTRAALGSSTTPDAPASCKVVYVLNFY